MPGGEGPKRKAREKVRRIAELDGCDHFPDKPLRKTASRACRSCGKDAYPDYFFCPTCHYRVCGGDLEECAQWEEKRSWEVGDPILSSSKAFPNDKPGFTNDFGETRFSISGQFP